MRARVRVRVRARARACACACGRTRSSAAHVCGRTLCAHLQTGQRVLYDKPQLLLAVDVSWFLRQLRIYPLVEHVSRRSHVTVGLVD